MHYLHTAPSRKQVHSDVKPENMLVGEDGSILLSDFGIVKISYSDPSLFPNKQESVGTPPYMAPEQFQSMAVRASDQYSLGVVVYEWLSGVRPFNGTYLQLSLLHADMKTVAPPLRDKLPTISSEVERVVMRALARDS